MSHWVSRPGKALLMLILGCKRVRRNARGHVGFRFGTDCQSLPPTCHRTMQVCRSRWKSRGREVPSAHDDITVRQQMQGGLQHLSLSFSCDIHLTNQNILSPLPELIFFFSLYLLKHYWPRRKEFLLFYFYFFILWTSLLQILGPDTDLFYKNVSIHLFYNPILSTYYIQIKWSNERNAQMGRCRLFLNDLGGLGVQEGSLG